MFSIDPVELTDTRIQLHWSAQLLSATADAKLDRASDDSHSNLGWDAKSSRLVARTGSEIDVTGFELCTSGSSLKMDGRTLSECAAWLSSTIGSEIKFRDYDMPSHKVSTGTAFSPDHDHLRELSNWFSFGLRLMEDVSESRIWPHHFDLGFLIPGDVEGRSVGGGFSPGDDNFTEPYFYINPYGIDPPGSLPDLEAGNWTDKWFGAVLLASDIVNAERPDEKTGRFLQSALDHCQRLIAK